jgi:hypothetical protein
VLTLTFRKENENGRIINLKIHNLEKEPLFFGYHHFSDVTAKSRLPDKLVNPILVGWVLTGLWFLGSLVYADDGVGGGHKNKFEFSHITRHLCQDVWLCVNARESLFLGAKRKSQS